MATRNDLTTDFLENPRIVEVASPSTEIIMQDLLDTLRVSEEGFSTGLPHPKLVNASGKEDLGGGVSVGITVDLQNAQVSFEPRRSPATTGTVTTGSGTPVNSPLGPTYSFVDSGADFITDGIERGSLVINFTDESIADVIEVVSSTELRTRVLVNGTDNIFETGDSYQIFNIIQCEALGGNLVAQDENGDRIIPIFPSAFTQIIRTSSSSATLQEQQDIQYASFGGGVTVDLINGSSGTVFPTGTPRIPCGNFTDALAIAVQRGFTIFYIIGDALVDLGLDYTGYSFVGESKNKSVLTISSLANVTNAEFTNATITGTLDGGNVLADCSLGTINFVDGFIESCILNETITLSGAADAQFLDCYSGVPGAGTPTIDFGGSGSGLTMRNYNGGITLINKSGSEDSSLDLNSGQIIIADTVTNGEIILRGVGKWTNKDTYVGGANIVNEMLNSDQIVNTLDNNLYDGVAFSDLLKNMLSMATGRIVESASGVYDFYEQDNTTIAFTLTKSGSERTRS